MINIILAAIIISAPHDIELKKAIEWPITVNIGKELTIKSYYANLSRQHIDLLLINYVFSLGSFFYYYKRTCDVGSLEIRIISEAQMNSSEYFSYIDPVMYGRYFTENNHIYITPEAINKKEYLIHEMTHYLYDVCNMKFKSEKEEHKNIQKFIKSLGKL